MKTCTICKLDKSLEEFNKHPSRKDGLQSHCRECNKARSKAYYKRNSSKHKVTVGLRRDSIVAENRRLLWNYFKENPCTDCGEKDPMVLEFDHVRGKKKCNISQMARNGTSWVSVLKEIELCDVRCANCHRRRTAKQFKWYAGVA